LIFGVGVSVILREDSREHKEAERGEALGSFRGQ